MKAVVMAGGEGKRLRPLTCTKPKPLIKIMGKPVLGYILDLLIENGFDDIKITTGYRADDINDYIEDFDKSRATIECVREEKPLGTAGGVKNAAKGFNEPFLVISGDCITDVELSKIMLYHKSINADVTIVTNTVEEVGEYGTVNLTKSGAVESFCEKPDWSHASSELANTGIYIIEPSVLDLIEDNVQYDFAMHLFPEMLKSEKRLYGYQTTSYWCDIGDIKSLRKCTEDMMRHKVQISLPEAKNGIFAPYGMPEGNYSLTPPVYIGKDVKLQNNSVIGPYTVLEDNVSISGNTRIKRSSLGSNTIIESGCDIIGAVIGSNNLIKSNNVCLEGSVLGDGCTMDSSSTISNNVLVWPGKHISYRSVLLDNLRDGCNEDELTCEDGICGSLFSEISCEKSCRIGQALASSTCGGKVGVGYGFSNASKALAMAALSGLISGGSMIFDFGECFHSQMNFFVSFCDLDSGIFITEHNGRAEIHLIGKYGLSMSRKCEREIESRYKRSDFRCCNCSDTSKIRNVSQLSDVYEGELLHQVGKNISGMTASITSSNNRISNIAEKCMYLLGIINGSLPQFDVGRDGRVATVRDEDSELISHSRLLALAAKYAFKNGENIIVPFSAPVCIEKMAEDFGCKVYRAGISPMKEFDSDIAKLLTDSFWSFDGLSLCFNILGIMKKEQKKLSELKNEIPEFATSEKVITSKVPPQKIASFLGIKLGEDSQGLRKELENGYVSIYKTGRGRLIKIIAEAASCEAANEICVQTGKKITDDTIDIYHQ